MFRIHDIVGAIVAIREYTSKMDLEAFSNDRRTVDAVVRNLIIIGEAATHVPDEVCEMHPEVPWDDMRAMRNFVVHEVFGVSDSILWETVQHDLPSVEEPLSLLLETGEG